MIAKNVFEAILKYGHDEDFDPFADAKFLPTDAPAGSQEKIEVLRRRVELGQPLWHKNDRIDYSGLTGAIQPREDDLDEGPVDYDAGVREEELKGADESHSIDLGQPVMPKISSDFGGFISDMKAKSLTSVHSGPTHESDDLAQSLFLIGNSASDRVPKLQAADNNIASSSARNVTPRQFFNEAVAQVLPEIKRKIAEQMCISVGKVLSDFSDSDQKSIIQACSSSEISRDLVVAQREFLARKLGSDSRKIAALLKIALNGCRPFVFQLLRDQEPTPDIAQAVSAAESYVFGRERCGEQERINQMRHTNNLMASNSLIQQIMRAKSPRSLPRSGSTEEPVSSATIETAVSDSSRDPSLSPERLKELAKDLWTEFRRDPEAAYHLGISLSPRSEPLIGEDQVAYFRRVFFVGLVGGYRDSKYPEILAASFGNRPGNSYFSDPWFFVINQRLAEIKQDFPVARRKGEAWVNAINKAMELDLCGRWFADPDYLIVLKALLVKQQTSGEVAVDTLIGEERVDKIKRAWMRKLSNLSQLLAVAKKSQSLA